VAAALAASAAFCLAQTTQVAAVCDGDDALEAARKYVESHDDYLHHSKVAKGMTGYGLTVMEGAEIVKFDVSVVSVMTKWGPHQDVILARLSKHNLENYGVIAGMSGSPVFLTCPDGKARLVGAVAFAYRFQKEPLCGIQPITQMIAGAGILNPKRIAKAPAAGAASGGGGVGAGQAPPAAQKYFNIVLDPAKGDFSELIAPRKAAVRAASGAAADEMVPQLLPLSTPIMASGISDRTLAGAAGSLKLLGAMPVKAGGLGAADAAALGEVKLQRGSAIGIPLVSGDADLNAVGTVTDVIDGNVLAFGHSFLAHGDVSLPMGPAYVHTVISSMMSSFKLASSLGECGVLQRDEEVGICGRLGPKAAMVPMTVSIDWKDDCRTQTWKYRVANHRLLTGVLARLLVTDAAAGWRQLPEFHTVSHEVTIDFGKLGKYTAVNVASDEDVSAAASDTARPIVAMLANPLGPPPSIEGIDVKITIESGSRGASIVDLKLDGQTYKPGETIRGTLVLQPFRQDRAGQPVEFRLPADLPAGQYTLTACDSSQSVRALRAEMPQRFEPRTVPQLLEAIERVVQPKADRVYLRVRTAKRGLAVANRELLSLPPSKAQVLSAATRADANEFQSAIVREQDSKYVLSGEASASFTVEASPQETLVRTAK
jgi:hypothetical protein